MLQARVISKYMKYTPFLMNQRCKVRILPKEHYDDDETPYFEKRKPRARPFVNIFAFLQRNHSLANFKDWYKKKEMTELRKSQRYIPERHQILGPDLATAQFITARDGKVKIFGKDEWVTPEDLKAKKIPTKFVPHYFIEEIDASGTKILYEAFENMCNLKKLKKLSLKNCPYVDDWCLSRFHLFARTLEYLDISGCPLITERGICTLHVLRNLKTLIINDMPSIQNKELVSLLLQDIIPGCDIIGVDYDDPNLLKRLESYHE